MTNLAILVSFAFLGTGLCQSILPAEKPGQCLQTRRPCTDPTAQDECKYDYECPGKEEKCCQGPCAMECMKPYFPVHVDVFEKPGKCLQTKKPCIDPTAQDECKYDYECPGKEKCCQGPCAMECMEPGNKK